MNPGELDRRAVFLECVRTSDEAGGFNETWIEAFVRGGKLIVYTPTHVDYQGQRVSAEVRKLYIRKDDGISPSVYMRVNIAGNRHTITNVRDYAVDGKYYELEVSLLTP